MGALGVLCAIGLVTYGLTEHDRDNKKSNKYREDQNNRLDEDPWDMLKNKLDSNK